MPNGHGLFTYESLVHAVAGATVSCIYFLKIVFLLFMAMFIFRAV